MPDVPQLPADGVDNGFQMDATAQRNRPSAS